jgi:transcription-repair coupling factor (superfamily II helicase)
MALSGLRNMSIIETPPQERQAIKTVIAPFDRETIKKAIELELERNGQVYFVHNRIKDIEDIKGFIERLVPQARVAVAHGQMNETLTEDIMLRFLNQEIDILVCTNIIGSGIDIPSVNTIIINRAHEMGLADLYQLRGRVGRSNIKAYCYLLTPPDEVISENAKKRLSAIADLSYLGAGIRLAMTDLEIRGAGNLLGPEQSGHINAVGFELYMELLEKAIRELRGEKIEEEIEPVIDIPLPALIPEEYVDEIHIRLNLYRRLSMIGSEEELSEFSKEVEERFGSLPEEVENLLKIVRLKNLCKNTGIKRLVLRNGRLELYSQKEFQKGLVENLLSVLQDIKGNLSIAGSTRIIISLSGGDTIKQVSSTIELLKRLNSYFLHHGG